MRISDWSSDVCSSDLLAVERPEAAQVDDLGVDTLGGQLLRCLQRLADHDREGGDGDVLARPRDPRLADRHRPVLAVRHLEARSEEHTSELQSLMRISYAVFLLKKKTTNKTKSKRRI